MAGLNAFVEVSVRVGHRELIPGSGRLFESLENGFEVIERYKSVKNTTNQTWTMPSFRGRGPLFLIDETNLNTATVKINNTDANNIALNVKPFLAITQSPTTLYVSNSSTTTDAELVLVGCTDSSLS